MNSNGLVFIKLGGLFRINCVEILARCDNRAAVFSWLIRKIPAIKPLPFKPDTL